jgi:hypothetical protein
MTDVTANSLSHDEACLGDFRSRIDAALSALVMAWSQSRPIAPQNPRALQRGSHENPTRSRHRPRHRRVRELRPGLRRRGRSVDPVPNGEDSAPLDDALRSVVDDILKNAIGFTPTVVTLQSARRVGDRIYMLFVIADKDGEEMIEALSSETSAPTDTERAPSPSPGPTTGLPEVRPPSTANPM